MRIAFISDIHGNVLALDAVLRELEHERFDRLVCLGDVAVGPQPHEAMARVRELGCPVIMGNWDAWFLEGMPRVQPDDEVGHMLVEIGAWWADGLTDDDRAFLTTFEPELELSLENGARMLCFHGSPRSYNDWIFATTPDDEVAQMLDGRSATVFVGGHTHLQMARRIEGAVIVNPGSVGLPFRQWWPKLVRIAPWAEYGLVCVEDGKVSIDLHRTTFDVKTFLALAIESGMPHAEWWAESWTGE